MRSGGQVLRLQTSTWPEAAAGGLRSKSQPARQPSSLLDQPAIPAPLGLNSHRNGLEKTDQMMCTKALRAK
eukprot:3012432-Rhodomonas_salina.3